MPEFIRISTVSGKHLRRPVFYVINRSKILRNLHTKVKGLDVGNDAVRHTLTILSLLFRWLPGDALMIWAYVYGLEGLFGHLWKVF